MTRRNIIFKNSDGRSYVTPEFNGDKAEFETFHMGDTCLLNWDDILNLFAGASTLKQFRQASKQAQEQYISNVCYCTNVFPVEQIKNINEIKNDEVYLLEDGAIKLLESI